MSSPAECRSPAPNAEDDVAVVDGVGAEQSLVGH